MNRAISKRRISGMSVMSKISKYSRASGRNGDKNNQMFNSYKTEQIEEFREIFKMYDRDNTGAISSRALKFLLRGLGDNVNQEQVDQVLKEMDQDGNGTIDFQEFLLYMLQKVNAQSLLNDIVEIFKVFDRDSTGFITPTELKILLGDIIPQQMLNRFIQQADSEGQGEINYQNYLQKLLKQ